MVAYYIGLLIFLENSGFLNTIDFDLGVSIFFGDSYFWKELDFFFVLDILNMSGFLDTLEISCVLIGECSVFIGLIFLKAYI